MNKSRRAQCRWYARIAAGAAMAAAVLVSGCGLGPAGTFSMQGVSPAAVKLQGSVHGGQQPVTQSSIQLYAANFTGYGLSAVPLLTTTVSSDRNGNFSITNDYSCSSLSSPTAPVYIVAAGGNSGTGANSGIGLMAALGPCNALTSSTMININELTTIASAYALSGFMSSPTQLSTSAGNITGMSIAFGSVNKLVNTSLGTTPGRSLPTTAVLPIAELNTLANILAACINSTTGSSACTTLFSNATPPGGTAPSDTLTAALNIAKNPSSNTSNLFGLVSSTSPFQPMLSSAPSDFTIAVKYPSTNGFSTPSAAALDVTGNLWVTNAGNNSITVLDATTAQPATYAGGGISTPSAIAFDSAGNAWVADQATSQLSVFTSGGVGTLTTASGLSSPSGVAVDGAGSVWVTNAGNNSVTANTVSGTTVVSSASYNSGGVSAPTALAINPK